MRLYLPDTNVLIYGLADQYPYNSHLSKWIKEKTLALSSIVVAEFLTKATEDENKIFEALLDKFGSLPVDTPVARIAAEYRKSLYAKGYRLKLPDCLIAATCKLYNATLITFDNKDFPMTDINKLQI